MASKEQIADASDAVWDIIEGVRHGGLAAVLEYTERFDGVRLESLRVGRDAIEAAYRKVPPETLDALRFAHGRIKAFAERQMSAFGEPRMSEAGIEIGIRFLPAASCGCYVPAGRYPLPSSALMSVTAAKAAGVPRIAACSPPSIVDGEIGISGTSVHPAILAAMDIAGADEIYCMGGAQAIAAFAYGTEEMKSVDFIAGPGNRYVTEAKRQVLGRVGIDGFAGPSEVLIIADASADPSFIAADLLSQAEHDPDARAVLVCMDAALAESALSELSRRLDALPNTDSARKAWEENGHVFLADTLEDAIGLANSLAPEHLELQLSCEAAKIAEAGLRNYGSLFIGPYAPVALGDFVSGTNHILPTAGSARYSGGLWVGSFLRAAYFQSVSREGFGKLARPCVTLAETEGLKWHAESVKVRIGLE